MLTIIWLNISSVINKLNAPTRAPVSLLLVSVLIRFSLFLACNREFIITICVSATKLTLSWQWIIIAFISNLFQVSKLSFYWHLHYIILYLYFILYSLHFFWNHLSSTTSDSAMSSWHHHHNLIQRINGQHSNCSPPLKNSTHFKSLFPKAS